MPPFQTQTTVPVDSTFRNARAFVRNLNILLKFSRLYGLEHTRSAKQFESTWLELRDAVDVAGQGGLLLGASGSQLLLDGVPLESTTAERSFAHLLDASGVASISFTRSISREEFANLVRAFMETGPKALPLGERLEKYFGKRESSGVRVNEIRFVAEDAGYSDARMAAQLTAKTLGADANAIQDWFRSPEKMIQLIAAAEGSHGGNTGSGAGSGIGGGKGSGAGVGYSGAGLDTLVERSETPGAAASVTGTEAGGSDSAPVAGTSGGANSGFAFGLNRGGRGGPTTIKPLEEAEMQSLLRLLVQFGEASHAKDADQLSQATWQQRLASLPQNAQMTLREALATVASKSPSAKMDEAMLLQLAQDLAIRFALDRFQRGEVRVNAVRQMLERMGNELETLRKLLKSREERIGWRPPEVGSFPWQSHADVLDTGTGPQFPNPVSARCSLPRKHDGAFRRATSKVSSRSLSAVATLKPPETYCRNTRLACATKTLKRARKPRSASASSPNSTAKPRASVYRTRSGRLASR